MARITFDTDATSEDAMELIDYEDNTGMPGVELRFDFDGQKSHISFFVSHDDIRELIKALTDKL